MKTSIQLAALIGLAIGATAAACTEPVADTEPAALRPPSPLPGPRGYTALVYDSQSHEYVALGGTGSREVWAASGNGRDWRLAGTIEPGSRIVTAAYHAGLDRIVVWLTTRGRPDGGGNLEPFLPADAISETYTYDLDTNAWQRVVTAVSPPPGLFGARMAYDAESRQIILFGGYDVPTATLHDETWAFDLDAGTWTNMSPATHPTGRNFHGQVYHAAADRIVVIAGVDITFEPINHVWAYDYNANTWAQMLSPGAPARDYVAAAYVDETERVVLHGGMLYGPNFEELAQSDTWEYDLGADRWDLIDAGGGDGEPGPRAFHALAARSGSDQVLMFGGGAEFFAMTSDVWRYTADDHDWKQLR